MAERDWRWLDLEANDPRPNVAIEEAIFRAVPAPALAPGRGERAGVPRDEPSGADRPPVDRNGEPRATLRLWRNPPCVVVGCHQWVELEVNLEACRRHGTPVVRRFTGGGAVYHDLGNLNFTLCIPRGERSLRTGIPELYDDFTLWLRKMLGSFGTEATLVRNRIEVQGKKISGLAASVSRSAALVHGTLLVSTDLAKLSEHLKVPAAQLEAATPVLAKAKRWVRSQPSPVTSLERECAWESTPPVIEVARRARRFVESTYGIRLERARDLDRREADCLAKILEAQAGEEASFGRREAEHDGRR